MFDKVGLYTFHVCNLSNYKLKSGQPAIYHLYAASLLVAVSDILLSHVFGIFQPNKIDVVIVPVFC